MSDRLFQHRELQPESREDDRNLGLSQLLVELSDELAKTHAIAVKSGMATTAWTSATVQIDVAVELTASGGVKFWVANAEGAAKRTRSTTLTVNIRPTTAEEAAKPDLFPGLMKTLK